MQASIRKYFSIYEIVNDNVSSMLHTIIIENKKLRSHWKGKIPFLTGRNLFSSYPVQSEEPSEGCVQIYVVAEQTDSALTCSYGACKLIDV